MSSSPGRGSEACQPPERTLVVLCSDWPAIAAAAAAQLCPGGGDLPLAVVDRQRVVAALAAARAAGVRPGQRRREAEAHCPALVVLPRDEGAEVRAFEPAVRALESLGVPVTLRRPGWASFPTRGPARRHGGEAALAERVRELLVEAASEGTAAVARWKVGVADGPFAATAAARHGVVVPRGRAAAFLAPLPVAALGDAELTDLFGRLGLHHLGDVAALDEGTVLARFGAAGGRAHRLARGLDPLPLAARPPAVDLTTGRVLDPPAERLEEVVLVARGLAEDLAAALERRGLRCTLVRVEAETEAGERLARCWSDEWGASPGLLAERLRWQLEAWLDASARDEGSAGGGRSIAVVRLVPLEAVPAAGRQLGLFAGGARLAEAEERAARVLARVQGMLDATAVLRPVRVGGRGPGERVRLVPVGDPLPEGGDGGAPWPGRLPAPSPTVVPHDPPVVEVLDSEGGLVGVDARGALSAAPASLCFSGERHDLSGFSGPFPVDERWWDGRHRRRCARLQVLTATGEGYLVTLNGGCWVLEGRYD